MLRRNNPFRTGINATPPVLAGRGDAIEDFTDSLEEEPGGLERVTLLYGFRGVGKTALLTELGDRSRAQGWHVCDVTAGTPGFMDKIREFAAVVQHLIREERNIAVVMAGLPSSIRALVEDKDHNNPATFIRKADKVPLGNISDEDVRDALVLPLRRLGIEWNWQALDLAVEGSSGYPFMVQLVGSYIFRASAKRSEDDEITLEDATVGVAKARRKIGALVNGPAFEDLSETDRSVLVAMSIDDGDTSVADLRERLELADNPAGRQYVNTYRKRLIDAGVVEEHGMGRLRFTMPFMREYLREHFSSDIIDNR